MIGTPPTRQPDVAFVLNERLPAKLRLNADFAPDMAAEIVSESDTVYSLQEKVIQYLNSGVRIVWIIYPVTQTIDIYRPRTGTLPQSVGINDTLDGEDVLPSFKLPVKELFE
jgi:Uma2 family endonuclease